MTLEQYYEEHEHDCYDPYEDRNNADKFICPCCRNFFDESELTYWHKDYRLDERMCEECAALAYEDYTYEVAFFRKKLIHALRTRNREETAKAKKDLEELGMFITFALAKNKAYAR